MLGALGYPQSIGGHQLLDVVGEGGNAAVFKALDPVTQTFVALKAISDLSPLALRARFFLECTLMAEVRDVVGVVRMKRASIDEPDWRHGRMWYTMTLA